MPYLFNFFCTQEISQTNSNVFSILADKNIFGKMLGGRGEGSHTKPKIELEVRMEKCMELLITCLLSSVINLFKADGHAESNLFNGNL